VTAWLRRAGRGVDADGAVVTWSLAEGRRGRRWRESRVRGDAILSSLLFETDPDGRFSHLELSTPAGLLTLHPEGDGTIHGNTVTEAGVGHVVGLPWDADGVVLIEGSSITAAAAAAVPSAQDLATVLRIGVDLTCNVGPESAGAVPREAGAEGLPRLRDARSWPLE
jgi:hypothetical protein